MTSRIKWRWWPLTSGVAQELILGPELFNFFINAIDDGTKSTPSKFADDTKLGEVADTSDSCAAIQKNLNRPQYKRYMGILE